ncbi:MAG TPA: PIN domain protein [Candidatus Kapabacteria bacterium]|nr:PIN domain protein [Candidatus Kapabacteria bacterium]HPO63398.1 PIN domain protein [Candidatus Kapabacteria bacterium]
MHKLRIYIDTSVIGGCFDKEFAEWSNKLFDEFIDGKKIAVISDITLEELEHAPENIRILIDKIPNENIEYVALDNESDNLAELYIKNKAITRKFLEYAQHIAISTVVNVDVLVSWNFKHIVNLERIKNYNSVNIKYNYKLIEIRTPREVLYGKY